MYKISDDIINFITNSLENWREELTVKRQTLNEIKTQRGIFQGDSLLLLLFVSEMMSLNTSGYKFTKSQEKVNHLMYMDIIKVFAKI